MTFPPTRIYIHMSDDGKHIRQWSRNPFSRGTEYSAAAAIQSLHAEIARKDEAWKTFIKQADALRQAIRAAGIKREPLIYPHVMAFDAARAALNPKETNDG